MRLAQVPNPMSGQRNMGFGKPSIKRQVSPARFAAFHILRRVAEEDAYASILLDAKEEELQQNDRALCHGLVMGVLRHQSWLDRLIAHYGNRDPNRLDLPVRIALRLGLYQLRFLSRIPASAAVNESVSLVQVARVRSADKFVNAVLRRATSEPDYDPLAGIADPIERLAIETSHPAWLVARWVSAFGVDETEAFARSNNQAAPVAFRIVRRAANEVEILELLKDAQASISPSIIAPGAWRASGGTSVVRRLARAGRIYVQDEASQLAAQALNAHAGERVLDVCAAPGSKTTAILDLTADGAQVIAGDRHHHRLRVLTAIGARQEFSSIQCVTLDAQRNLPFVERSFDRVLVDAPCSGTGTLRRNPEIRWRISAADIDDLSNRQECILLNASRMVRAGGSLVYSTCSVEPEENEKVAQAFLEKAGDYRPLELNVAAALKTGVNMARTWPHRDGSDGFFIAAFQHCGEIAHACDAV